MTHPSSFAARNRRARERNDLRSRSRLIVAIKQSFMIRYDTYFLRRPREAVTTSKGMDPYMKMYQQRQLARLCASARCEARTLFGLK